ncbi:MAG: exodeoxyribonuclease V subunit gamma [Syntrophus sp. (in: bacteria)]|nr:exodeoxyribonuclease V subunit gamma [Syntrophus sp. (in: bacteria)]
MAGLNRYTGNRLEILADRLAECIRSPLAGPLTPEIIVVQSKGMERWLSMELAHRHGVCANVRFPFPNAFINELFRIMLPEYGEAPAYDPEITAWRIMRALPDCLDVPEFETIRRYLHGDDRGIKGYQFACRLADLFDQYLVFRPEMMLDWEAGKYGRAEEAWQAQLWRLIRKDDASGHPAFLQRALLERLRRPLSIAQPLPERVSIFGVSWLPRFHLEILHALSRRMDIHIFAVNPCREFWTDIRSERETGRAVEKIRESTGVKNLSATDLHLETGNSLLASMGTQGRDFFRWLTELPGEEHDIFTDPGEATLLQAIQSDILNLRERSRSGLAKTRIDPSDRSLQIHSCHSPMREVEVLYDQILALFDEDKDLLPRDILVMAPDMNVYAPLIQAVFNTPAALSPDQAGAPRIPFAISDRSLRQDSPIMDGFLALLELAGSRFEASSVLALLEAPPVMKKFGLTEDDMERVRRWVDGAGIRWGIDAESRVRAGLPGIPDNTWTAGMQRLFLGYALPGKDEQLFHGILPYDAIEGLEAQTLGSLAEYLHCLFASTAVLVRPATPVEWTSVLSSLLNQLFEADEETQRDLQAVRQSLQRLTWLSERSGFIAPTSIEIIKLFLRQHFEQQGFVTGYISGGVTCCTMLPMRSIPFKVICLLGMNHDGYPRSSRTAGFDLIAKYPRPGDRSRRHDDRYLFLEALLSARQKLIISYVGQHVADNSPLPPSVVVSELLDAVEQGFTWPGGAIRNRLTTNHRLQAFHPDYFSINSNFFSYSEENSRAAHRLQERRDAPVFFTIPLPDPGENWKIIEVSDLVHFFRNPCRFLMERRLAATLREHTDILIDRESFDIRGLEKYDLEQRLVDRAIAGQNLDVLFPLFRASGRLPHGNVGASRYKSLIRGADDFAARIKPHLTAEGSVPVDVQIEIAGFQLNGHIENLYPGGMFHFRYADLRAGDHLRLWIHHLALAAGGHGLIESTLIGRDQAWSYPAVGNAQAILEQLLIIYWKGLSIPLKFLPESSLIYMEQLLLKGKREAEALRAARSIWAGSNFSRGESEDPYYQRCFAENDPLDEEFQQLAVLVYEPLLKHRTAI